MVLKRIARMAILALIVASASQVAAFLSGGIPIKNCPINAISHKKMHVFNHITNPRLPLSPSVGLHGAKESGSSNIGALPNVIREACERADDIINEAQIKMESSAKALKDAKSRKEAAKQRFLEFEKTSRDSSQTEDMRAQCTVEIAEAEIDIDLAQASFDSAQAAKYSALAKKRGFADALSDSLLPKATGLLREAERAYGRGNKARAIECVQLCKLFPCLIEILHHECI
jgi:hypothetical protein